MDVQALGNVKLEDATGTTRRLGDLWADRPVVLRFVNGGRSTHGFRAPRFFRSARLRRGDEDLQLTGSFRLGPGEQRRIALVPVRGRYRVSSPNIVQSALGMRALIVVE